MKIATTVSYSADDVRNILIEHAKKQPNLNGAGTSSVAFHAVTKGEHEAEFTGATVSFELLAPKGAR